MDGETRWREGSSNFPGSPRPAHRQIREQDFSCRLLCVSRRHYRRQRDPPAAVSAARAVSAKPPQSPSGIRGLSDAPRRFCTAPHSGEGTHGGRGMSLPIGVLPRFVPRELPARVSPDYRRSALYVPADTLHFPFFLVRLNYFFLISKNKHGSKYIQQSRIRDISFRKGPTQIHPQGH